MLDIGWSELLLIGVVALIVVGPKDLPIMFKTLGRFTAKARSMAREFQRAMDDAAKSTGVSDTLKDVRDMTSKKSLGIEALENAASKFEKWNPTMPTMKPAATKPAASVVAAEAATAPTSAEPAQTTATMGPATKALAEKRAAERAELLASVGKTKEKVAAKAIEASSVAATETPKPVRKAVRRTKPAAAAPAATTPVAAPVTETAAPKTQKKPRAKKTDA